MTNTLRVVEAAADLDPDEKVRLVVRMLLGMSGTSTLELGALLGLGRTAIYDRTQGRKPFSVSEVVTMGRIFGIAPEAFLAGPQALIRSASGAVIDKSSPPGSGMASGSARRVSHPRLKYGSVVVPFRTVAA